MSTNIRSFHTHFSIGTLCLLKSVSSTVVCKRVSWSGRLSHDTSAVKDDAHCWIFAEELKIQQKMQWNRPIRYGNRLTIWGITLRLILCCKFTENYRIPFRLCWEYGTVPVAFSTTDTVPYPQTLRLIYVFEKLTTNAEQKSADRDIRRIFAIKITT